MSASEPGAEAVYQRALNLLARRDHSVAELRRKLLARSLPASLVEEVLEKLVRQGYLDDRRFAAQWAGSALRSGRGVGMRLQLELQRRGIARDIAAAAVDALSGEYDGVELLAAVVARRFAGFDPAAASPAERRRVFAALQRRGFSGDTIRHYFNSSDE